jgi:hypothetical protein
MEPNTTARTCRFWRNSGCWHRLAVPVTGIVAALLLAGRCQPAFPQQALADPAAALQAKRIELQPLLRTQSFGEPLHLSSREGSDQVEGDVHAEVGYALAEVAAAFNSARSVCELLFLHLNTRDCQPSTTPAGETLTLTVGPKRGQALGAWYRIDYTLRVESATSSYLRATLSAARGPLSTRDYRIVVEAVPVDSGHSFIHLGYSYGFGFVARMAMMAYLATAGRAKIGFTVLGQDSEGQPLYVRGERAALERNVVRYYLALLAYCGVNGGTPQQQMEGRLRVWFAHTERYAAQLHEFDLDEYLHEKHDDLARRAGAAP